MTSHSFARGFFLDHPLYAPLAAWLGRESWPPPLETLNRWAAERRVCSGAGQTVRFVPANTRMSALDYERQIAESGEVPTRQGDLHDLFNALVWLAFPHTKAALNRLHSEAPPGGRTPQRDFATLLDESGMLIAYRDGGLVELLRKRAWRELLWSRRTDVARDMRFFVVGHALYQKAQTPYPGITAHALAMPADDALFVCPFEQALSQIDAAAAELIDVNNATFSSKRLTPLPVFGIPGWHANQGPEFYADTRYFRPARDLRDL